MSDHTPQDVTALVVKGLEELGVDPDGLDADTRLEELDIDSLDVVELRQMLAEETGVRMTKEEMAQIRTIGDIVGLICGVTT